jgi:AGCS family alanine or glycine:cation symporter
MEAITEVLEQIKGVLWGTPMLILILGTGVFLMAGLRLIPLIKLSYGFNMLWRGRKGEGEGDISAFNALMTSLSATIGTGNIAGVATAIVGGGPGALFWMWCVALVGLATKYAEAVCAVRFRETDDRGLHVGGPMYYIKNGLGRKWAWLGTAFAIFGALAGFGIGNTIQANSVADAMQTTFGVDEAITGLVIMIAVALVLVGGVTRIAKVAGNLVPFMALAYVGAGLVILLINFTELPAAFDLVITHAFTPTAAIGGFEGAAVWAAIQFGVARGVFSNEAGLGSAPIAHAAAKTNDPVRQGTIAMLGTFIDTIIICSITGLVIVTSGAWTSGESGAVLSSRAYETVLPGIGNYIVTIGLALFAFTTLLGWSYYGERCAQFLFGSKSVIPFRLLWVFVIPVGAIADLDFIWLIADILNALMALPNLIALLLLSPVVFALTREYFRKSNAAADTGT